MERGEWGEGRNGIWQWWEKQEEAADRRLSPLSRQLPWPAAHRCPAACGLVLSAGCALLLPTKGPCGCSWGWRRWEEQMPNVMEKGMEMERVMVMVMVMKQEDHSARMMKQNEEWRGGSRDTVSGGEGR